MPRHGAGRGVRGRSVGSITSLRPLDEGGMRVNPFQSIYRECNRGDSKRKNADLIGFPRYIDIEITNKCNFNCLMCPTGTGAHSRPKGMMSDRLYHKIIDELKEYKTPLRFIRWGEPTLHPKLIDYLRIAHDNGIITHINTNGSLLNKKMISDLIDIPIESIKFSFQGINRDGYAEMRNIDYFDELIHKIKLFHSMRGDNHYPYIHVSSTVTCESLDGVREFKRGLSGFADLVTVGRTNLDIINLDVCKLRDIDKLTILKLREKTIRTNAHMECPEVFDKLSINWDGSVTACCGDFDNKMVVGNLLEHSLRDLWTSEKMNYYRNLLADMRHDELDLCKTCRISAPLD